MPPAGVTQSRVPVFRDARGALTLADFADAGFPVRRAYVLHDIPAGARRAGHAHRTQHRLLVVVCGRIAVEHDDGMASGSLELSPGESLRIEPGTWHELVALTDGVLVLVLASGRHDPLDVVADRAALPLAQAGSP